MADVYLQKMATKQTGSGIGGGYSHREGGITPTSKNCRLHHIDNSGVLCEQEIWMDRFRAKNVLHHRNSCAGPFITKLSDF